MDIKVLSKPLRPFRRSRFDKETIWTRLWDGVCWLPSKVYYFCRKYSQRIKRSWAYAKFGWENYDFDGDYLTELMTFKLKRMQKALQNGWSIQNEEYMQALRLAIRLGERLKRYGYHWFMDRHNAKWGEPDMLFTDSDDEYNGEKLRKMEIQRAKVVDEETAEQERREFRIAYEADDNTKLRDARLFFRIVEKYYPGWWD